MYRRVDPETTDFWEKSYFDEEEGEGVYSDGESDEGNEYSDEEYEEPDESDESEESEESDG